MCSAELPWCCFMCKKQIFSEWPETPRNITTRILLIHDSSSSSLINEKLSWVPFHDGFEIRHVYRVIIWYGSFHDSSWSSCKCAKPAQAQSSVTEQAVMDIRHVGFFAWPIGMTWHPTWTLLDNCFCVSLFNPHQVEITVRYFCYL